MPDITITGITDWITGHLAVSVTVGVILSLVILAVISTQVWAAYRGRALSARASALFAVVQAGVAFVTITGVYDFWEHRVGMPWGEAALIAAFIEAVTWAAVADIYVHGEKTGTVGLGASGGLFWAAVIGGGVMAIIGSDSIAVAVGRTVVVALGAMMWHVKIRQRTRARTGQGRWANPFKTFALRQGWMIADDTDVTQTSREWQVRTLTRAMYRKARTGRLGTIPRALGERTIRRVMEAGDADMVRDAQRRFALQEVLRTEITPTSTSMGAAMDAAREALNPPPEPDPAPAAPPPPPPPVTARPARRTVAPTRPTRVAAAASARQDPTAAGALREQAIAEAMAALSEGRSLTGKDWGARYDKGEEWGRQRLIDAHKRMADGGQAPGESVPAHVNGSAVG